MANYLDSKGVQTLWDAVKDADKAIKNTLEAKVKGIALEYSPSDKKIYLKDGQETQSTIDVADFIKDGMLKEVSIYEASSSNPITYNGETYVNGEKFLRFLWNGDAENLVNLVKLDEIAPVYEESSSIAIDGNNKLHVKEVGASLTKTTEAIPVAGGPLADLLNKAGITQIDANTDMQALLFQLLCKELWPEDPKFNDGSITTTISIPSLSLNGSQSSSTQIVEAGSIVPIGKTTISAASTTYSRRGWIDVDYGYATELNGDKIDSSTINATIEAGPALNDVEYTLTRTYTGFVNAANSTENATSSVNASSVVLEQKSMKVTDGECSVTASVTGPNASITFAEMPAYYICSNTGKTSDEQVLEAKSRIVMDSTAPSNSVTRKIKGVRYAYAGTIANGASNFQATSDGVRGLTRGAYDSKSMTSVTGPANCKQVVIAFPSSWGSLTKVSDNGAFGTDITGNFNMQEVEVEGANNYTTVTYKVYVFTPDAVLTNAVDYTITIA